MARRSIFASLLLATCLAGCLTPSKDYHGYIADEAQPSEIKPGEDTRNTVLAQLGSPSTESIFDDNTWVYMTAVRERLAFMIRLINRFPSGEFCVTAFLNVFPAL